MKRDEASVASQYLLKLWDLESNALLQKTFIPIEEFRTAITPCFNEQIFLSNPQNNNKNIFHYLASAPVGQELSEFFHQLIQFSKNISPNPLWEKMLLNFSYNVSPMQYAFISGNLQYACLIFDFQCAESPAKAAAKLHDVFTTLLQMITDNNYSYLYSHLQFLEYAIKHIKEVICLKENKVGLLQNDTHQTTEKGKEKTLDSQAEQTKTVQNEENRLEEELLTVKEELKLVNSKLLTSGLIKACELYRRVSLARAEDKTSIVQLHQQLASAAEQMRILTGRIEDLNNANLIKEQQIIKLTTEVNQACLEIESLKRQLLEANRQVTNNNLDGPHENTNTTYRRILPNLPTLFTEGQRPNKRKASKVLQSINKFPR